MQPVVLRTLRVAPLSVPLSSPFVIATARMEATRAVLVQVELVRDDGVVFLGLGEAAALPPVTREDQPELLATLGRASSALEGLAIGAEVVRASSHGVAGLGAPVEALLNRTFEGSWVARAAVESALLDAFARAQGVAVDRLLAGEGTLARRLHTDITLSIAGPDEMVEAARAWSARGFDCFKVKVGHAWQRDCDALRAVHDALPGKRFRLDANEGFSAKQALALLDGVLGAGLVVECFEQPCLRDDVAGMVEVTRSSPVPVVADESLRSMDDLEQILRTGAARGVNLKLVKLGGPLAALAVGRRAKAEGLGVMAGAMVETRLGLSAMAHVVSALGGVDWVDLDTHLLLASDPFVGGMRTEGPRVEVGDDTTVGLGCTHHDVSLRA